MERAATIEYDKFTPTGSNQNSQFVVKRTREPSYAKTTVSAIKRSLRKSSKSRLVNMEEVNASHFRDQSMEQTEVLPEDEQSKNPKYRLFSLERKFQSQSMKSKEKLDQVQRKMYYLQNVNFEQQEKLRKMDQAKRETSGSVVQMHDKLKTLNHRIKSQSELQRHKEEKYQDKIAVLEKRIETLCSEVESVKTKKVKPLPFQREQMQKAAIARAMERKRSQSAMSGKKSTKSASKKRPKSRSKSCRKAGPPRLSQNRGMSEVDMDETLQLQKSSSPKYNSRLTGFHTGKPSIPLPLRNYNNRGAIAPQKKIREPSAGYLEYA